MRLRRQPGKMNLDGERGLERSRALFTSTYLKRQLVYAKSFVGPVKAGTVDTWGVSPEERTALPAAVHLEDAPSKGALEFYFQEQTE